MFHEEKKLAGRACIGVSVLHIGVDFALLLSHGSRASEFLHALEPALLVVSTFALAVHLVLERAIFDWVITAAHGTNLTFGWVGATSTWLSFAQALHQLSWFSTVASLALGLAALATFAEVTGLRVAARRAALVAISVSLALCVAMTREEISGVALPPTERTSRSVLIPAVH